MEYKLVNSLNIAGSDLWGSIFLPMAIFISEGFQMKVATWTLKPGLSRRIVEVVPVGLPGHPRVCGRKKSTEGVRKYIINYYDFDLVK
jgi:hypothetical protein